jgi:hypothetical protein
VAFDRDGFAVFRPLVEPALALALLLAPFVEVEPLDVPGADLLPVARLDELRFAVFVAGFDTRLRRASLAMVPTVDPSAAPAFAGAPSRTSSRAAFRALLLATAVTTAAVRASRTIGFLRSSLAFLPTVRARVFVTDDFAVPVNWAFGLLPERVVVLATVHLRN